MKRLIAIIFMLAALLANAQNNLSISPEKPRPGEVVKFTYTPPTALANEKDPLHCTVYKMGNYNDFYMSYSPLGKPVEMEIKKTGASYSAEVVTDAESCGLLFLFSWGNLKIDRQGNCTSGKLDNNDKKGYFIPLFTADEKPCATAFARMANYLSNSFSNKWHYQNLPLAREYYLKEMAYYPEKTSTLAMEMVYGTYNLKTDTVELRKIATKQLERIFEKKPATDADYQACTAFFTMLGLKKTAAFYREYASENNIKGYFRSESLYNKTEREADLTKKKILLDSTINSFKSMDYYMRYRAASAGGMVNGLVENYLAAAYKTGNKDTFAEALRYVQQDTKCGFEQYYPNKGFIEAAIEMKNYDEALKLIDTYFAVCKQKYELLKKNPSASKPEKNFEEYLTKKELRGNLLWEMVTLTKMYATTYSEKGDCRNALAKLDEYRQYAVNPEIKEMGYDKSIEYELTNIDIAISMKCKPLEETVKALEQVISGGKYDENIVLILKGLYVKKNGTDKGFTEYLIGLKKTDNAAMSKKLEEMKANEKAPDFTLMDMEGKPIKLSELIGKTVILDFWATWCGPCRASFPAMQQLVDYYKPNPKVVFLFIDTFEGKSGGTTIDKMKQGASKIITEKNYSFHVLFDLVDEVAAKYKVTSIPAKFVIDKNGMIRYKAVGGGLFSDLVDEMQAMIKAVQ